jgi:hypothetical protein
MPAASKIQANEATIENLKINERKGISSNLYEIYLQVPPDWVGNPVEGIGISASFINHELLKSMLFYCASNTIEKVNKTSALIRLETSEHYLNYILDIMKRFPKEAELKLGAPQISKE